MAPISQRAYAKHRKISHVSVNRAVKSGRLSKSVDASGQIIDVELADREWDATTDYTKAHLDAREAYDERLRAAAQPARAPRAQAPRTRDEEEEFDPSGITPTSDLADLNRADKYWKAKHAELKFREAARELLPAFEVRQEISNAYATCRVRLLGIPSRAKQALPHLSVADIGALEVLIRESLEALAAGES